MSFEEQAGEICWDQAWTVVENVHSYQRKGQNSSQHPETQEMQLL
jgi:hypothetical protein